MCYLTGIALVAIVLWTVWRVINKKHSLLLGRPEERQDAVQEFLEWYVIMTILLLTAALIVQCKLPYQRVFSFLGVWVSLLIAWLIDAIGRLVDNCPGKRRGGPAKQRNMAGRIGIVCSVLAGGLCVLALSLDETSYSLRDEFMRDAYEQLPMEQIGCVAVTDCDQEYYLLYAYDMGSDRVTRQIEEADAVLIDKALLGMEYGYREGPEEWKFYLTAEEIPESYLEEEMKQVYENWHFILYEKK